MFKIQDFFGPVKLIEIKDESQGLCYRFFGIHKDKQLEINFAQLKRLLISALGRDQANMIQLIGDSNQFTEVGTNFVRNFLKSRFAKAAVIEYGFTGYKTANELDVNSFVTEFLEQYQDQADKVIANIVGHTHIALTKWGTIGSAKVRNFTVIYNEAGITQEPVYNEHGIKIGGFTTFGDDIITSDNLLQASDGDRFICLEGGAQSFKQVTNALSLGIPVELVYNLRKPQNIPFFSAARFLKLIYDAFGVHDNLSKEQVREIYARYMSALKSTWDMTRPDHRTKKELFEKGINDFIENDIYKQVKTFCTFFDAQSISQL